MRSLLLGVVLSASLLAGSAVGNCEAPPQFLLQWGSEGTGPGQFGFQEGVCASADGSVYVADKFNSRIQKFTADGVFLASWPTGTDNPLDLDTDAASNVFALFASGRILKFASSGSVLKSWGSSGTQPGQFLQPKGIGVGPNGHVFVADYFNYRLQEFDNQGQFVLQWSCSGIGLPNVSRPLDVAVHPDGRAYVLEEGGRILVFLGSQIQFQFGGAPTLNNAYRCAFTPQSALIVSDGGNRRVVKYSANGVMLSSWGSTGSGPGQFDYPYISGVAVGSDGSIYVSDPANYRIQKFGYVPIAVEPTSWSRIKGQFSGFSQVSAP